MKQVSLVVAVDNTGGFGRQGKIPWHFPEDLKHFQEITTGGVCIMGRKTAEDLLTYAQKRWKVREGYSSRDRERDTEERELLPNRECIVLSGKKKLKIEGASVHPSIRSAIESLPSNDTREIFVIGGEKVFVEALAWTKKIYLTIIKGNYYCDRHFPTKVLTDQFVITDAKETDDMYFVEYTKQ